MGISEAIREGGHWTELITANKELVFQVKEKGKRAGCSICVSWKK